MNVAAARARRSGPETSAIVLPVLGVIILLAVWQLIGTADLLGRSIPPPTDVVSAIQDNWTVLKRALSATLGRALVGGAIGYAIGLLLALMMVVFPASTKSVERSGVLVNAIPIVALGPVLITMWTRPYIPVIFAAMSVFLATMLAVGDGLRAAPRSSTDMFGVFGAKRRATVLRLQVPTALPMAADALKLAIPAAILGAILGEWFGSDRGAGVLMVSAMRNVQYGLLWAAAVLAALVSVVFYGAASLLERFASKRFGRATELTDTRVASRPGVIGVATVAMVVVVVALWQLWIMTGDVPQIVAPKPVGVLGAMFDNRFDLGPALTTTSLAFGGVVAGAVVGLVLAVLVTMLPWLRSMLAPLALLVPTIPIVVFIPIMGSVLGYGTQTVFAACVLMAFFPMYVFALSGLHARPAGSDDLFAVYGVGRFRTLAYLALPSAVPTLMVAVRLAAASAFLIALSAEWLMGRGGLGRVFSERRVVLDTNGSWAAVVVAISLSVLAYAGATKLEKVATARWRT